LFSGFRRKDLNVKVYDGETDGRQVMRKVHMAFDWIVKHEIHENQNFVKLG
jgi:hypothetical protein